MKDIQEEPTNAAASAPSETVVESPPKVQKTESIPT